MLRAADPLADPVALALPPPPLPPAEDVAGLSPAGLPVSVAVAFPLPPLPPALEVATAEAESAEALRECDLEPDDVS